jgi:hypothetical protein
MRETMGCIAGYKTGIVLFASRVVTKGAVESILRVLTKQAGNDEKNGGVSSEIR